MKQNRNNFILAILLLAIFLFWTVLVCHVDVKTIGPRDSAVGFATVNGLFHRFTGVHMTLYTVTDWLGLVPVAFAFGFAVLGLCQWIRRKKIWKVDANILILGGFYLAVIAVYLFFEDFVINRRPILIAGYLEASYPSSTTLLTLCVMPTARMQLEKRIRNQFLNRLTSFAIVAFCAFMVVGRLVSGVHWLTDIIGGGLISASLVTAYRFFVKETQK